MKPCVAKSHAELARAWDGLAEERHRQISLGLDLSFDNIVAPMTLRLFRACDPATVLDVGSGTGEFTAQLAEVARTVFAVDPSQRSMALAKIVCRTRRNVEFVEEPLEEAASALVGLEATSAVAVMSLMTTPQLREFTRALAVVLRPSARFVAVFTHPWFWPKYWCYEDTPWFRYNAEIFIEAPFATSTCVTDIATTHVHRPLEQYLTTFAEEGFVLEEMVEPMPSAEVEALYPRRWAFPRFIGLRWRRTLGRHPETGS